MACYYRSDIPTQCSVNEGIEPILCSLTYLSIETVAHTVSLLGTGAIMAKIDIEVAYRLLPVHPQDRLLLVIEWNGEVFCDAMLPFGLRSAPKIFNAVADGLEWILQRKGINIYTIILTIYNPWPCRIQSMR